MLGTFRLVLALAVALSHVDVKLLGLNPGVVAVVCFYLISGYVMTGLLRNHYGSLKNAPHFYLDRALRIYPQYLAVAGVTLAWFYLAKPSHYFLSQWPGWSELTANLAIVPLNFYMFNGSDRFTLIPPAWSLGAEILFYLAIPFLLLWRLRAVSFFIALGVFALAAAGTISTEYYGYRLLPGVLIFFLLGSALYDVRDRPKLGWLLVGIGLACAVAAWTVLAKWGKLALPYNRETLLGLVVGLPLLYGLGRLPQHAVDNRLGDLSYGVFLNHFLVQWTLTGTPVGLGAIAFYLACSLVLSALIQYMIERPVLRWRHRLRNRKEGKGEPAPVKLA